MSFPNLYDRWLFFYSSIDEVKVYKLISVNIDALALVEELAPPLDLYHSHRCRIPSSFSEKVSQS